MKKILTSVFGVLFLQISFACGGLYQNAYCGDIRYSLNPNNPLICTVEVTIDFDVSETLAHDSIQVNWGDGSAYAIFAISVAPDAQANAYLANPLYRHIYAGTHTYNSFPAVGYYRINTLYQFRVNAINNIGNGNVVGLPFYVEAIIEIDSTTGFTNLSPVFAPTTIGFANPGTIFTENPGAYDLQGDSVGYVLMVSEEDHSSPVPVYLYPDQYCYSMGETGGSFTIDHATGEITWATPCVEGIFAITRIARKYRNGRFLGSVMRDENIYVSTATGVAQNSVVPQVQLSSNPALNTLIVTVPHAADSKFSLDIISVDGRLMMNNSPVVQNHFDLDISSLAAGFYLLRISDGKQSFFKKFVKE